MAGSGNFLTYVILGILALASWWAAEVLMPREPPPPKLEAGKVDYYSKNIRRTLMDETGKPKEMLVAESLTHYENDNHTELRQSELTLYSEGEAPWVIRADLAELPANTDDVFLYGNVVITRGADSSGRTVRIETTNARVQPGRKYAETDDYIQVLSPPDTMTGVGATVSFADELSFTVLSNVKRKHEVTKP
jgi:lipopolysaccharide export system protein LptC